MTRLLEDRDGLVEHPGVVGLSARISRRRPARGVTQRVDRAQRPLALDDVAAEILAHGLLAAHEVEHVVLDLERESGGHAEAPQRLDLLLAAPPTMAPTASGTPPE